MRSLLLVVGFVGFSVLSLPASAQTARPTNGQVAWWTTAGVTCGVAAGITGLDVSSTQVGQVVWIATVPLAAAACVHAAARLSGYGGPYVRTLGEVGLGAAGVGLVTAVAGSAVWLLAPEGDRLTSPAGIAVIWTSIAAYALVPAHVAARRVHRHGAPEVSPVTLRLPDGTTAPGLALRIGL